MRSALAGEQRRNEQNSKAINLQNDIEDLEQEVQNLEDDIDQQIEEDKIKSLQIEEDHLNKIQSLTAERNEWLKKLNQLLQKKADV